MLQEGDFPMTLLGKKKQAQNISDSSSVAAPAKKRRHVVPAVIVLLVIAALLFVFLPRGTQTPGNRTTAAPQYTYGTAQRRDLTATLSDSGALEPINSYTVTSLVSGEILSAAFETGDVVTEDDILYLIDSEDASNNIERAENTLDQRRRSLDDLLESKEDLTVEAPISGTVSGFSFRAGDKVNNGAVIATVEDTSVLLLTEYYSDHYADLIHVGMPATVSISEQMLTLSGRVRQIHSHSRISETGVSCFAVTVEVDNPGSLVAGGSATCWLSSTQGDLYPTISDEDGFDSNDRKIITAGTSGTVETVCVRSGEIIRKGDLLMEMSSETLDDSITTARDNLRDAELALDSQYEMLDNYNITAPINGTIVDKFYKQGENAESGRTLCTIFDLSALSVSLYIDELDIKSVAVGQTVRVTCDSVPNTIYEGTITEVSINGTTSGGVTTYPVKVQIDETDGLLPGMNVDMAIVISETPNALTIPAAAVQAGSRVLVKTNDGTTGNGAPEGYQYVKVELGASDEDFVEITSGLKEGDEIAWIPKTATGGWNMMMGMGMPGMGMGGMRPGGQMSGVRPGGTQTGNRQMGAR